MVCDLSLLMAMGTNPQKMWGKPASKCRKTGQAQEGTQLLWGQGLMWGSDLLVLIILHQHGEGGVPAQGHPRQAARPEYFHSFFLPR